MTDPTFKVDFFCVGVAKAGTTSLHELLDLQERVSLPKRKETNYFSFGLSGRPAFSGPLDESSVNATTITSLEDYINDFDRSSDDLIGEICPSYALPGCAENIHRHNPEAKIIILLREPVSRSFSNYQHMVRDGREPLEFEQALAAEDERLAEGWEWFWGLKRNSFYYESVKSYVDTFGPDKVKILFFEDFIKDQETHLRSVMEFIGLDPESVRYEQFDSNKSGVVSQRWKAVHRLLLAEGPLNSALRTLLPPSLRKKLGGLFKAFSTAKGDMPDETRAALAKEFEDDLTNLRELVGVRVDQWLGARDVP
jgi:hypothetical protein